MIASSTVEVLRRTAQSFYCVHGHPQHYPHGPTQAEKLQKQLEKERRARQRAEQNVAYEAKRAEALKRSRDAHKGQVTRLRKRAKAGVCPCCNRSFVELRRHMANKHPEFESEAPEE